MRRAIAFARMPSRILLLVAVAAATTALGAGAARDARSGTTSARTSFGLVAVTGLRALPGIRTTPPPHSQEEARVEVRVELANRREAHVLYAPGQFRLRLEDSRTTVTALSADFRQGALEPGASMSGRLVFVVPRHARALTIEFHDLARARPVRLALPRLARAGADPTPDDAHHRERSPRP